jgi:predicted RNA-binding protein YlxR (DUF448 family)
MSPVTERSQRRPTTSEPRPAPDKGRRRDARDAEGSLRRCIVTGESLSPERLIRFVVGPERALVPDLARELPGRGVWVTAERSLVAEAVKKRLFGRAFARAGGPSDLVVPEDLGDLLERLLARRAAHWLGLARRVGGVVAGFEKVREAIQAGEARFLVQASDGGADGLRKLRRLNPSLQVVETLTSAELSLALGRENVVHAALQPGRLAVRFLGEARRLAGFRQNTGTAAQGAADLTAGQANDQTGVDQTGEADAGSDAACVDARMDSRAAPHAGQGRTDE